MLSSTISSTISDRLNEITHYLALDDALKILHHFQHCNDWMEFENDSNFWEPYINRLTKTNPTLLRATFLIQTTNSLPIKFLRYIKETIAQKMNERKKILDCFSTHSLSETQISQELNVIKRFSEQKITLSEIEFLNDSLRSLNEKLILSKIDANCNTIDISKLNLTQFPESLFTRFNWKNIEYINCEENNLIFLPEALFLNTPNLKGINFSRNKLQWLPTSIGNCTELLSLNGSHNDLETIPDTLGKCVSMKALLLNENKITKLPESLVDNWQMLEQINCQNNHISNMPSNIGNCINLIELEFSGNLISIIPDLSKCTSLKTIDISHNKVQSINEMHLPALENFYCQQNKLKSLPPFLYGKFGYEWCLKILNPTFIQNLQVQKLIQYIDTPHYEDDGAVWTNDDIEPPYLPNYLKTDSGSALNVQRNVECNASRQRRSFKKD
ncbi:MAG: leucine-rich repeat domain-containing protein [Proteobacteria bacterium]|nr:leucine-rich repeat domain-containing protein [Pseudomonadota bacterium]